MTLSTFLTSTFLMMLTFAYSFTTVTDTSAVNGTAQTQQVDNISAQDDWPPFGTTPIPFEITSDFDDQNVDYIHVSLTKTEVTSTSGNIGAPLREDGIISRNEVLLFDTQDRIIGIEVLRPLFRTNLVFSHENTTRASIMSAHPLLYPNRHNIPNDPNDELWIQIYNATSEHPRFDELTELISTLDFIPVEESDPGLDDYYDLIFEIALDLAAEYFDETGQPRQR
ncbi:MAG: hypothetical protein AAF708_00995 [Deinococcota bacterium]